MPGRTWLMIPLSTFFPNVGPLEDQFEKRRQEKKERAAKNEYQRLRNIARNQKGKIKGKCHVLFPLFVIS